MTAARVMVRMGARPGPGSCGGSMPATARLTCWRVALVAVMPECRRATDSCDSLRLLCPVYLVYLLYLV